MRANRMATESITNMNDGVPPFQPHPPHIPVDPRFSKLLPAIDDSTLFPPSDTATAYEPEPVRELSLQEKEENARKALRDLQQEQERVERELRDIRKAQLEEAKAFLPKFLDALGLCMDDNTSWKQITADALVEVLRVTRIHLNNE